MLLISRISLILLASLLALSSCATIEKRKEESSIHYRLGVVHLSEGNLSDALKELTTAVELYPGDPSYHNSLGLAYFARGMNEDAKREMKEAVRLDPKFSEAHVNLSAVYMVERRWDLALEESREAVKNIFYRTPEAAYTNIGWAYHNKGDYQNALESYRKALELNPNYAL